MTVIKGKYDPNDLIGLADLFQRNTIEELKKWIHSIEQKPILLLHVITMIQRIAESHGHDAEHIKRLLIDRCKQQVDFINKVEEWENENGGKGVYAKAMGKKIDALMQSLNS